MSVSVNTNTSGAGTINGTITIHQDSNGTIDGLANTPLADQVPSVSGSVIATLTNLAVPVINNAQPISFGNVRIGTATTAQTVSVTNGAPVSAFSEGLIGNATGTTGTGIIASGGFGSPGNSLAAGQTNPPNPPGSSSISVNIDTSSGGAKSGNAVIDFQSDGTGFSGGTVTDLGPTNVAVSGNVYRLANPTLNTPAVTLAARVNGPLATANVSVTNTSPDIYTEALKASFGTAPTGFSNTGSLGTNGLAAQGTNASGLTVGLASTGTSGITTGTATVNFVSTGAGTDNAADISVGSQNVALTGKVYQTAVASVTPGVSFGIVHVGDTVGPQTITVTNTATGALVDSITGSMNVRGAPFSVTGGGTLGSGVAGNNGSSGSALRVGLNTSTAGVYTGANAGSATLTLASHDSDLADLALTTSPVTLSATVNNYAAVGLASTTRGSLTGGGSAYTLNLGTLTQGSGLISAALAALNAALAPADALSLGIDSSGYSVESGSGFGLALNAFADLAAGDTQGNAFDVSLDTSGTGTFDEVIKFDGYGSNADYSDNNANVLDPTLTIEATVTAGGSGPPTGVPEPSSWLVLLSALAGLGSMRRLRSGSPARVD